MVDPQHPTATKGGIEYRIAARERPGVGGRRLGRRLGASGLNHNNRLGQGHLPRRRQKRSRVANRLHIDDDAVGMGVIAQVVDQVAPAHIEHRTQGDKGAKADIFPQAPIQN